MYGQENNRRICKKLSQKIYDKSVFPESGTPLLFLKRATGYRYIIYKSYLAFYRIKGNEIIVERVLFAKSNYFNDLIIEEN
ncbi:MAG: type II toxin-antitoxin system RelE/ParE family toxin [Bacilli bacterium]|nr:type II toxin-antitoxin system RelE/ParE family toxin [Bacilli bacterium]